MDALPLELIILVIVAFFVGVVVMWLFNYIRGQGNQQPGSATESEGLSPTDAQVLLCVMRTESGQPDVLVQGQRYRRLREITNAQMGHETVEALRAIMAFAEEWLPGMQPAPHQPPPGEPATPSAPAAYGAPAASSVPGKPTSNEETFLEQLRQSNPLSAPRPSVLVPPTSRPRSDLLPPLVPPADQINKLIQQRLRVQPDLVDQKIRLVTGPDGGLIIHVGLQTFNAVNDISDPKAKALIQEAILEWESG